MSSIGDTRRGKSASPRSEAVDFMTPRSLARALQRLSAQMRLPVLLPVTVGAAILGVALLLNGVAWGGTLIVPAFFLAVPGKRARHDDRPAVRLALRLASAGERTLLVETAEGVRVARAEEVGEMRGRGLQFVGARANGALILARRR
jgi:hypothetical protein